jgi:hypothetical protein
MDKSQLKDKFKKDFELLKKSIIENDPIGLIDGGAPDDEYDSYIPKIISDLEGKNNLEEITEIIKNNFSNHFGDQELFDEKKSKIIAEKWLINKSNKSQ